MFPRQLVCALALAAGALCILPAPTVRAGVPANPLLIVSQSVRLDHQQDDAVFSLTFDHTPDFFTLDAKGRRKDSFQYEIVPDVTNINQAGFFDIASVIRGDELDAHQIPIRGGINDGIDPSPAAGGWGFKLGTVNYALTQNTLSFAAPLQLLSAPDGLFAYRVFTTDFGSTVSLQTGSTAVPLPPGFLAGGAMLLILTACWQRRRFRGLWVCGRRGC